ncbi:hypothetical protein A9239_11920 [Methanosarcina sp. A14]|uniref:Acyltransferase 3 domain-containing protein n=2 Tax=Methanosarcina barkeri TaxID=2208 RepID=A0A0E3LMJ9_METBA|nr:MULTISPECIES: acyltransferase [Methanosarcina]AKB53151.1 hypothetical protein MSBRM_0153 [Methanosarcina barkeri MS]OED06285.1 hypothetical protein A9239_11920 [Methanosarcina sp. A14]
MKEKILTFDFLRAIAILAILLTHSTAYLGYKYIKYTILIFTPFFAKIGLSLFVFISGYLIHYNNSKISSIKDVLLFYKKRFLRIFPLYWVALAVFTFVFYDYSGILSSQFIISNANTLFSFRNLLIHILGMQMLLAPTYSTPLFTLHFVGTIIIFYLIYPFLMLYSKNTSRFLLISFLVFMVLALISGIFKIIHENFFSYYPIFIAGIVLSRVNVSDRWVYNPYFAIIPTLFLLSVLLQDRLFLLLDPRFSIITTSSEAISSSLAITVIKGFAASIGLSYEVVRFAVMSISSNVSMILFCVAQLWIANICINDKFSPMISSIITYVSTASYTVYLFHRPVLALWVSLADRIHMLPFLQDCITIILIVPALFIVSYYIQTKESFLRKRFFD